MRCLPVALHSILLCAALPSQPQLLFGFDSVFGPNMVLQQAPAKAAVYGFMDYNASMAGAEVLVTLTPAGGGAPTTVRAALNATYQTFGPDWGVRPCATCPDINPPFNPFNQPLASWKALLPPQPQGGDFTVTAACAGCSSLAPSSASIVNVTFGDVWFCQGQSNMWLPVRNTYERNFTARNISQGRYSNIRMMAGVSGNWPRGNPEKPTCSDPTVWPCPYGGTNGSNAWVTAAQAAPQGCVDSGSCPLFAMGGACFYFALALADGGVTTPIGIADAAIGGQHIEEFMQNHTIARCTGTAASVMGHDFGPWGNAEVFGSNVVPFLDLTLKGFVWYQGVCVCVNAHCPSMSPSSAHPALTPSPPPHTRTFFTNAGENNMGFTKGNSAAGVGYSCLFRELINGYRALWSATPGTTDPLAPFGAVALPSGGSEGGPNMGAMRLAQTLGYGVLPTPAMPNTWIVQAYDLEDQWGSGNGPCFGTAPGYGPRVAWACCPGKSYNATACAGREALCAPACEAAAGTAMVMGGIHPRSKKPVGERLARGALNTVYGGTGSITGPTLARCAVAGAALNIEFDADLLRGDTVVLQPAFASVQTRFVTYGGTLLWALANATTYCIEPQCVVNATSGGCASAPTGRGLLGDFCPTWAGGDGVTVLPTGAFSAGWVELNYTLSPSGTGIVADLAPLNGTAPAGIRYAWDSLFCCDLTDPTLYVSHDCIAKCPIMSSAQLPANPFHARIVQGACECQAPQVCS